MSFYHRWKYAIQLLPSINYDNKIISFSSLSQWFRPSIKAENDIYNKYREIIIYLILSNNEIIIKYCNYSLRWNDFRLKLINCLTNNIENFNFNNFDIIYKARRSNNYDFLMINKLTNIKYNIEFKFGVNKLTSLPQIVSPYKPSEYITNNILGSYEEYYYDNYLLQLYNIYKNKLNLPYKEEYIKQINSTLPKCMELYKKILKEDITFRQMTNKFAKNSIKEYLNNENTILNIPKLNEYITKTQHKKIYLFYKDNKFNIEQKNINLTIINIKEIKFNNSYICNLQDEIYNLKILLRWKNGNGVAFPALQISLIKKKI